MKKWAGKSNNYKGVYIRKCNKTQELVYEAHIYIKGKSFYKYGLNSEREAAIKVDLFLIENGLEPVNILKRK